MFTLSEENYLKAIYHLGKRGSSAVSTNAIANRMRTKASSVTDMLRKLSEKRLANYQKYKGVHLTQDGKLAAINVIRKHRLWETFMVNKLNFAWDEVHDIADQLEHIKSEKLINQLDEFLGHPTHDPHGDPIPDEDGNIHRDQKILLSQVNEQVSCTCIGVKDSSSDFLKYLDKNEIALGTNFEILSKESFDASMRIQINNEELVISKEVANNIFVKIS
jgi:DtxR family Mn-dependent transcriptional regulator